jgi:hypothetical protein
LRIIHAVCTGFEHADSDIWVFGQAGGDAEAGCTTSDDEVVVILLEEVVEGAKGRGASGFGDARHIEELWLDYVVEFADFESELELVTTNQTFDAHLYCKYCPV